MNIFTKALTLTAAVTSIVMTAPAADANLAGEFNQQQDARAVRLAECNATHARAQFKAEGIYRQGKNSRVAVDSSGGVWVIHATYDGTQCDMAHYGQLNEVTTENGIQSQFALEGSELVRYTKHLNTGYVHRWEVGRAF